MFDEQEAWNFADKCRNEFFGETEDSTPHNPPLFIGEFGKTEITLRDYVACQLMAAMLTGVLSNKDGIPPNIEIAADQYAEAAFVGADCFLAVRQKGGAQ